MTKEEYRLRTGISGTEEAQALLNKSKILFAIVFICMMFVRTAAEAEPDYVVPILGGYLALLGYFVFHCVHIVKKTRDVTKADAIFSIIFAPVSWIWFYPALIEPLKIITGDLPVPAELPTKSHLTDEQKRANWKGTFVTVAKVTGIAFILMVALAVLGSFSK